MQDIVQALYNQYPDLDKEVDKTKAAHLKREQEMQQVFEAADTYAREQERRQNVRAANARRKPKVLSTTFTGVSQTQLSKFEKEVVLYKDGKPVDSTVESSVNTQEYTEEE